MNKMFIDKGYEVLKGDDLSQLQYVKRMLEESSDGLDPSMALEWKELYEATVERIDKIKEQAKNLLTNYNN